MNFKYKEMEKIDSDINKDCYTIKMIKNEEMIEGKIVVTYQYPDEKYYVI